MSYWGISLFCWSELIGVVMHGQMVCINYLLHVRIICYTGAYFSLWWDGWLCALYLWFSILHGGLMSLWSVFAFVASLSPYMSTFLQYYNLWYCDWLHTTLLETEMDRIRFHPESIDGLPCQEFMRWFDFAIVVLLQIMMCICWALSLRSVGKEFIWDMKKFVYILLETFVMRCCFFLTTMFAAACFIGHFSSLMKPWYWGIPPSLRLSSLGFDFFI